MGVEQHSSFPTTLSDISLAQPHVESSFYKTLSSLRRSTLSIPNRLDSILKDANFVVSLASEYGIPLVANERCGSWYIPPEQRNIGPSLHEFYLERRNQPIEHEADASCTHLETCEGLSSSDLSTSNSESSSSAYFKSTDGHHGQWSFSLRRLNLQLLRVLGTHQGAILVDSTRRGKSFPDALRRTVPIWVAVWNRVLFGDEDAQNRGDQVHPSNESQSTVAKARPRSFVAGRFQNNGLDDHEVWQIEKRIPGWIEGLRALGLNFDDLRRRLKRPIRCIWVVNDDGTYLPDGWSEASSSTANTVCVEEQEWNTLVLCSASKRVLGAEMSEDGYIQGAGDDSEGWSHGLTAKIFWEHKDKLLTTPEPELPDLIKTLVEQGRKIKADLRDALLIKPTRNIFLAAGAIETPGELPEPYDVAINCNGANFLRDRKLLVLGCSLNKLGSRELRKQLASVKDLIASALQKDKESKIVIMDESGRDLSVGVMVVILCLFYNDKGEVCFAESARSIDKQFVKKRLAWITAVKPDANPSRSTLQAANSFLMERRD